MNTLSHFETQRAVREILSKAPQRKKDKRTTDRRRQTNNRNRPVQGSQYSDDGARIYKFRRIGLSIRGDTGLNDSARVAGLSANHIFRSPSGRAWRGIVGRAADLLGSAGFVDTAKLNRNAWIAEFSWKLADHMRNPGRDALAEAVGEEVAERLIVKAETRAIISAQGQLRPGHLRARKPGQGEA